jgi:hypothetical protein
MTPDSEERSWAALLAFAWQLLRGFAIGIVPYVLSILDSRFSRLDLAFYFWVPTVVFILTWRRSTRGFAVGLWLAYAVYFSDTAGFFGSSRGDRDPWRSGRNANFNSENDCVVERTKIVDWNVGICEYRRS